MLQTRVIPCLLLLDEGHRVKNPSTASARALRATPARYRLLLTGTPVSGARRPHQRAP